MINLFTLHNGRLQQIQHERYQELSEQKIIWVDITDPTPEDYQWVMLRYQIELPTDSEMKDIEASARFYEAENGTIHLRSEFLIDDDELAHTLPVAFVLTNNTLFSVHFGDSPVFRLVRMRGRSLPGSVSDYRDVLLDIYATDAEYSADALEEVYTALERVSARVLQQDKQIITDADANEILRNIAHEENVNGFIRRGMMDTRRALSFLMRGRVLNQEQQDEARQILRDIESLDGHTSFLFDKINFLMDAVIGFINVNQNRIVKIFSVASVALLPPTLIASIYGMNFRSMPELDWTLGYPYAIGLMAASVIAPLWYFYRRGWLR